MFYRANRKPVYLDGIFYNQSIFLVGGGPSTEQQDLGRLLERGIITAAMNNVAAQNIRPNIWVCTDLVASFCENIWFDPCIMKFIPSDHCFEKVMMSDGIVSPVSGQECPQTYIYDKISYFNHKNFLTEEVVSWGCSKGVEDSLGLRGCRSVMMATLKILYYLGFKNVYLLGADFYMQKDKPYSFPQQKRENLVAANNNAYKILAARFEALRPYFIENDFHVYNCSPNSHLKIFPYIDYEAALEKTLSNFPTNVRVKNRYTGSN